MKSSLLPEAAMWVGMLVLCMAAQALAQDAPRRGPSDQFFLPPGEPASHKLLSPVKGAGPLGRDAPVIAITPPADPRNFEGSYNNVIGYNALSPAGSAGRWSSPPFNAQAEKVFWHRVEMENAGTPVPDAGIECKPMGLLRAMNAEFGWQILQSPDRLTILINEDHLVRRIRIGGVHPRALKPSYMGDSVAHWDGDTLVVDSTGFNDRTWLDFDGTPHSTQLHVTERLRRVDGGLLEILTTIDDPLMYRYPWTTRNVWRWAPISEAAPEIICEENDLELSDYTGKDLQGHR
ncbi:MAG: hypothetical protein ABSE43_11635 [Steroidobacteraceae bacterium]|jgi:hypothetical protein